MKGPTPILLPPSIDSLLLQLANGESRFPLKAIDDGRFPDSPAITPVAFQHCRMPEEARSGLLLYAGFSLQSHAIAQDLDTREASYWHGIYHRLEPDDWNAMYWFRRVGPHEIHPTLCDQARDSGWNPGRNWEHQRFVDFAKQARESRDPSAIALAERVQLMEWHLLFVWCAAAKASA